MIGQLAFTFLGVLEVRLDGQVIQLRVGRMQNLVSYLVLEAATAHPRAKLAALLWPDEPEAGAKQNLRQSLYELRHLLGDQEDAGIPFLLVTRHTVQVNPACPYDLDVAHFHHHLAQRQWHAASELYQGELLPGLTSSSELFEEWLLIQREQLHLLAVDALDHLIEQARSAGDDRQVQRYARRQLRRRRYRIQRRRRHDVERHQRNRSRRLQWNNHHHKQQHDGRPAGVCRQKCWASGEERSVV